MLASSAVLTAKLAQYSAKVKKKANEALIYIKKFFGTVAKFTNDFIKAVGNLLKTAGPVILLLVAIIIFVYTGVPLFL